jgi:hypothetical protein
MESRRTQIGTPALRLFGGHEMHTLIIGEDITGIAAFE